MDGSRLMRRVATSLKNLLKNWFAKSTASTQLLPAEVADDELISSFLFRSDQVVNKTQTIRHSRLLPRRNPKTRRLETSVCRSKYLSEMQVWEICTKYFDASSPKPAIGRGVGNAEVVFKENLRFDADGKPYPEHANIIGWDELPNKPDNELKHFWIDQTQRMASQFKYVPRPKSN